MRLLSEEELKAIELLCGRLRIYFSTGAGGAIPNKLPGSGKDLRDRTEYTGTEDPRYIDWNAYARMGQLFVKRFFEEGVPACTIAVDTSASMTFYEKPAIAGRAALSAAYAMLELTGKVRLRFPAAALEISEKKAFAAAMNSWTDFFTGGSSKLPTCEGPLIVVSDFYSAADSELTEYAHKAVSLVCVQIVAPEEINPSLSGAMALVDSESQARTVLNVGEKAIADYKREFWGFTRALKNRVGQLGGKHLQFTKESNPADFVKSVLS